MIKLKKGKTPESLTSKEIIEKRETHIQHYEELERENKLKDLEFIFEGYGSDDVRKQLREDQKGKCCYCEVILYENEISVGASRGEIDHFRPKNQNINQNKNGDSMQKFGPAGYYWLAFDWDNLVYACKVCNSEKLAYFPLKYPENRASNHRDNCDLEEPLLINPYKIDPEEHIIYDENTGYIVAKPNSLEGKTTIKLLKLDRLNSERQKYLAMVKYFIRISNIDNESTEQLKKAIEQILQSNNNETFKNIFENLFEMIEKGKQLREEITKDSSRFAGMMRFLKDKI
ncbi:MAG: TIGR02646 family protein [Leptospiraceae bacterium]|nr:TIGR02646 family protein [Leptospiraceae bacterium]